MKNEEMNEEMNEETKEEVNVNGAGQDDVPGSKHDKRDRRDKKAEKKNAELQSVLIAKEEEISKLKKALDDSEDKYLRVCAEYDNYRKRAAKEKEACFGDAYSDAVSAFLPLIDNIDRACEYASDDSNLSKGVLMMKKQLDDIMQKIGITEIKADGEQFDPEKHNAIMHEEDDSEKENVIVQTFQKGYELKGKVIRHAMVKVLN